MLTSMTYDEITDLIREQLDSNASWDIQKYSVDGYDSWGSCWSAGGQELYVMEPNMDTVNKAKEYLRKMYNDEKITVVQDTE